MEARRGEYRVLNNYVAECHKRADSLDGDSVAHTEIQAVDPNPCCLQVELAPI